MIPVVWASRHAETPTRGYWDHAVLDDLFEGRLWRGSSADHFLDFAAWCERGTDSGAIVVLPARYHVNDVEWLNEQIAVLDWCLLVLTGDEESVFPWRDVSHPNLRVWVQTPRPGVHDGARGFGDWWPQQTREDLAALPDEKTISWFYAGQVNNAVREQLVSALRRREQRKHDGILVPTPGFTLGMERASYLEHLSRTKIAPCPSGIFTSDSFRFYEALEAGCLPIVDEKAPEGPPGYWPYLLGEEPPFPVLSAWSGFNEVCDAELASWPAGANRAGAWWSRQGRALAHGLVDDLSALGVTRSDGDLADLVTVVIPSSPIRAHPSTAMIEEVVKSVRHHLPHCDLILTMDGVRPEQEAWRADYEEYQRRVLRLCRSVWKNVCVIRYDDHRHQAAMLRDTLPTIRTPLVFYVEHDTPIVMDLETDFDAIAQACLSGMADIVRLLHQTDIHPEHAHLMVDQSPQDVFGAPMLRTVQWSQRPHMARVDYYARILDDHFTDTERWFIEDRMHSVVQDAWHDYGLSGWERHKVWVYAPQGNMQRSLNLDGRGDDPQYRCYG